MDEGGVSVLVVSEDADRRARWGAWLNRQGFSVLFCPGPTVRGSCPRLEDRRCPRRELADLAVVDLLHVGLGDALPPVSLCVTVPDDGRTVFVVRSDAVAPVGGQSLTGAAPDSLIGAVRRAGHRSRQPCRSTSASAIRR